MSNYAVIVGFIDEETMARRMEQTEKHLFWMRKKFRADRHPGNYVERIEKRGSN